MDIFRFFFIEAVTGPLFLRAGRCGVSDLMVLLCFISGLVGIGFLSFFPFVFIEGILFLYPFLFSFVFVGR